MKAFISYSHNQWEWVGKRLAPVLKAGGVEVLIDRDGFRSGHSVVGQMDATQDQAERQIICWSRDYAASEYCRHEWQRAFSKDPDFRNGTIQFLRLDDSPPPPELNRNWTTTPLWIDLRRDQSRTPGGCCSTAAEAGSAWPRRPGSRLVTRSWITCNAFVP
ncbi:MAG: toll/interleukin-1 receptor domain-containing protein [Methylococcales bacterium]